MLKSDKCFSMKTSNVPYGVAHILSDVRRATSLPLLRFVKCLGILFGHAAPFFTVRWRKRSQHIIVKGVSTSWFLEKLSVSYPPTSMPAPAERKEEPTLFADSSLISQYHTKVSGSVRSFSNSSKASTARIYNSCVHDFSYPPIP